MTGRFDPCGASLGDPALVRCPFRLASRGPSGAGKCIPARGGTADRSPPMARKQVWSAGRTAHSHEGRTLDQPTAQPRGLHAHVDWKPLPLTAGSTPPEYSSQRRGRSQSFDSLNLPPSGNRRETGKKCLAGASSLSTSKCPRPKCSRRNGRVLDVQGRTTEPRVLHCHHPAKSSFRRFRFTFHAIRLTEAIAYAVWKLG